MAILDEAFETIDKAKQNAEKNLQNARELFESYLAEVFSNSNGHWLLCHLEDYVDFIDYRGKTPTKTNSGIRLITAKNVKNGYLQQEPEEFIAKSNYKSWMTRGIPQKGDVLFTTEAPLANVAQLDTDEKVAFAQRIIILQPDRTKLHDSFLKYLLLAKPNKDRVLAQGTGATVQGIKAKLLRKIEIAFPKSVSEQRSIVKKLDTGFDQCWNLEVVCEERLEHLEQLKSSILRKAFSGELK